MAVYMFINILNNKIHYTVECADSAANAATNTPQNIVILPGWGCSIAHYHKIQTHLAQKFKVYAIDFPGYGLSPPPEIPWSTKNYAELITAFVNSLKIEKPILIGHSLGGKVAIYLTANKMVDCQKLILISSAGIKSQKKLSQYCKIYFRKLCKYFANLPILKPLLVAKLEAHRKKVGSQDYCNATGVMRATLVKLVNEDWRALLPAINAPTLLLWGEKDTDTPLTNSHIMRQLIPQSKLVTFANAGHHPFLDDFAKLINNIDEFLIP